LSENLADALVGRERGRSASPIKHARTKGLQPREWHCRARPLAGLSKKIKDVDKALNDRVYAIEKEQTYYRVIGAVFLAFVITFAVNWFKDRFPFRSDHDLQATSAQSPTP
jgi:hypothetical protein